MYWYHPHHHGTVADQVFGGLYGAIIVEDDEEITVDRERVMVVSDITLDSGGSLVSPSTVPLSLTSRVDQGSVTGRAS